MLKPSCKGWGRAEKVPTLTLQGSIRPLVSTGVRTSRCSQRDLHIARGPGSKVDFVLAEERITRGMIC